MPFRTAFTLIEIMLALFIGLVLLIAMNAAFRQTANAVKAGQTLSEDTRNGRAAQPVLFNDLQNCAPDSPAFIISSEVVPQFLNAADYATTNATLVPPLAPGSVPPDALSGCELGAHLHRCDQLMFFARGLYRRKTADTGFLASTTTSDEAYIHLGHLRVAKDGITPIGPDDYAGASEPYAADWVLGRNVILLSNATTPMSAYGNATGTNANAENLGNVAETSFPSQSGAAPVLPIQWAANPTTDVPPLYPGNVAPLGYGSVSASLNGANPVTTIQSSRYDLAGVTMDQFRATITTAAYAANQALDPLAMQTNASPNYVYWWTPLLYAQPYPKLQPEVAPFVTWPMVANAGIYGQFINKPYNQSINPVNGQFFLTSNTTPPSSMWFPRNRFNASNVLSTTPMTAQDQANLAPYFLEHVSQFIVEYAGDFVTQDNSTAATSGNVTDTVPDGQIDWVYATKGDWSHAIQYNTGDYVIYNGQYYQAGSPAPQIGNSPLVSAGGWTSPNTGPNWSLALNLAVNPPPKAIRWYGMPRDATGSGHVPSYFGISNGLKFPSPTDSSTTATPTS